MNAADDWTPPVIRSRYYMLALLYAICLVSYVDRQIVALLAADIARDLSLKDWQLGFLSGPAFALFYVIAGLPMARLADQVNRVRMLSCCLVAWSAATALCGAASGMVTMALARMGTAVGEAGGYPTSISLIGDYFRRERRAAVTAIYFSAVSVGSFLALWGGGVLNDLVGWRWTFVIVALPGPILALLMIATVREPQRGRLDPPNAALTGDAPAPTGLIAAYRALLRDSVYRWVVVAGGVSGLAIFSLPAWAPTYAIRTFDLTTTEVGAGIGIASAVVASLVAVLTGLLADRLGRRAPRAPLLIAAMGYGLCVPFTFAALLTGSFPLFCTFYALAFGSATSVGPVVIAYTQNRLPANMRGTAASFLIMVITMCGYGLGPPLVGAISDAAAAYGPAASLRLGLMCSMATMAAGSMVLLGVWRSARGR